MRGVMTLGAGTALVGSMLVTAAASAQCTIDPNPNFVAIDSGCPVAGVADPNGGCNVVPNAFQATGDLSASNLVFTIGGTCGQDPVAGSRDIDWFSFTVTDACFVNISVAMTFPDGSPSTSTIALVGEFNADGTPNCDSVNGFAFAACPAAFPEFFAQPGTYMCIITTDFAAGGGLPCESPYTATVSGRLPQYTECGAPGTGNCGIVNAATPGCEDVACCETVCTVDPLCCIIGWDTQCAAQAQLPTAAGGCGVFVYNCQPGAGAPANDCATAAPVVNLDEVVAWNNANASNDGPNTGQCGANNRRDVWFIAQAPADGNMIVIANSPGQDIVLSAYNLGTSPTVDGSQLANNFVGCLDNAGIGGEATTLVGVTAGNYYLWRIGEWDDPANTGVPGAGDVTITVERVVYDTGIHTAICNNGTATNLGLSSGPVAATFPQRWLAVPFSVTDPDGAGPETSWRLTLMQPEGFVPAGAVNEKLNWIIWSRNGFVAPNYATDQIASGQLDFPATLGANGEANIPMDLVLEAGDYYLTVFPSAVGNPCLINDGQAVLSNFAWFIGAPGGIVPTDGTSFYCLRSVTQQGTGPASEVVNAGTTTPCSNPAGAGFANYSLPANFQVCDGDSPASKLYSAALHILGNPEPAEKNPCPTDLDGNGVTDAADLAALLGGWGQSGATDLDGNGSTDAADLAALLGSWGACP